METIFSETFKETFLTIYEDTILLNDYEQHKTNPYFINKTALIRHHLPSILDDKFTKAKNYMTVDGKPMRFYFKTKFNGLVSDGDLIKKYYNHPFSSVNRYTIKRTIRKNGDKISISLLVQHKSRMFNYKVFQSKLTFKTFVFNIKTGDFYILTDFIIKGKKQKSITRNNFPKLSIFISSLFKTVFTFNDFSVDKDVIQFTKKFQEVLGIDNENFDFNGYIIQKFIELKKIKVCDDYYRLLVYLYPTEKYLKKNDRKLVSSILDKFGLKSKYNIKLVHAAPTIFNIYWLKYYTELFGKHTKYLTNINPNVYCKSGIMNSSILENELTWFRTVDPLTSHEVSNLCHVINDKAFIGTDYLKDHLRMLNQAREYYPELTINAKNQTDFQTEHVFLSNICSKIRKGWTYSYIFNDEMLLDMEKQIDSHDGESIKTYYPYVLKTEEEYIEEGLFMHHCVGGYASKETSVIISIRTKDKTNRITCEFNAQNGSCLQARYFNNKEVPTEFSIPLSEVKIKALEYARLGMLKSLEQKKIQLVINNKPVNIEKKEVKLNDALFDLF